LIRKTPPTSDTAVVIKKQKTNSPGQSKRRIRVGDFDQLTKSLTEDCIAIYRAQIGVVQPFPVKTDNLQAVQLAWVEVCNNRNLQIDIDDSVFKAVRTAAALHGLSNNPFTRLLIAHPKSVAKSKLSRKLTSLWHMGLTM
jgi:hypothetical protein